MSVGESMQQQAEEFRTRYNAVREQVGRVIVGHDDVVHGILTALFIGGHTLLEGVPGLGKTMLIKTLSEVLDLKFNRIQFTPDLMPSDILGTNMINENAEGRRVFEFQRGPIFTQICLADEINRATPKTQSALLGGHAGTLRDGRWRAVHQLKAPFFVMATQNPIEQEGTYPLPEAQLDRFLFKLVVGYSTREELGDDPRPDHPKESRHHGPTKGDRRRHEIRKCASSGSCAKSSSRPHVQDYAIVRLDTRHSPGWPLRDCRCDEPVTCAGVPAPAAPKRWPWPRRCERCLRADTTSALKTFAGFICPHCGIA